MPRITEHVTTVELGEALYTPHTTPDRDLTTVSLAAFDHTADNIES